MAKIVILNGNEVKELYLQGMNLVIQRGRMKVCMSPHWLSGIELPAMPVNQVIASLSPDGEDRAM